MNLALKDFILATNITPPFFAGNQNWHGIKIFLQSNTEVYSDDVVYKKGSKQYLLKIYFYYNVYINTDTCYESDFYKMNFVVSEPHTLLNFKPVTVNKIISKTQNQYQIVEKIAQGVENLFEFMQNPMHGEKYSVHLEYAGYVSNTVDFKVFYRPYPRDIYAGS